MIELMIVIAIVAILVALAVPAYKDYTIRSKVAECINQAGVLKLAISEYRQSTGSWPANATQAGSTGIEESQYCDGWTYSLTTNGAFWIEVNESRIDNSIAGVIHPRMEPSISSSDAVNWNCTLGFTSAANLKYLPSNCRDPNLTL